MRVIKKLNPDVVYSTHVSKDMLIVNLSERCGQENMTCSFKNNVLTVGLCDFGQESESVQFSLTFSGVLENVELLSFDGKDQLVFKINRF